MLTRHLLAGPTFGVAAPKVFLADVEVEGADIGLALTEDDITVLVLYTAQSAAQMAEVILRGLHKLGHTEVAKAAVQQAWLQLNDGDKSTTLLVPKNEVREAKLILP